MKHTSVRLALPLLSCTLLLTACPGATPTLNVPSDPAVLHGNWQGDLASATEVESAAFGGGQVYLLQREMAPLSPFPGAPSAPPKFSLALLALDAATGAELRRLPVESALAVRFRPAQDGAPARVLVLRHAATPTTQIALAELDPVTLVERRQTLLPGNESFRFSADGRWLFQSRTSPVDSHTLQPVTLPTPVQAELQLPQDTQARFVMWDFGERFLRVATRAQTAAGTPWTLRYFSADSGNAFGAQARHPVACAALSAAVLDAPADMVSLPDGGAALAYQDGTVELRDGADRLREVVNLGGCQALTLRVDGDLLTFADFQRGVLGTLRASDGEVLARRSFRPLTFGRSAQLVAGGTALLTRSVEGQGPLVALEDVSRQAWTLEPQVHTLRLETRATWQSKTMYTSTGTAVLDGVRLNFAATADSGSAELRPQGTPPRPVTWRGELRDEGGKLVARIGGHHFSGTPTQGVGLELQGLDRDFAFRGSLKR